MKKFTFGDGSVVEVRESVNIYELMARLGRWRKESPPPTPPTETYEVERMVDGKAQKVQRERPNEYDPAHERRMEKWEARENSMNGILTIAMSIVLNDEQRAELEWIREAYDFGAEIMETDEYLYTFVKTDFMQDQDKVKELNAAIGNADDSEVDVSMVLETFRYTGALEWSIQASNGSGAPVRSKRRSAAKDEPQGNANASG